MIEYVQIVAIKIPQQVIEFVRPWELFFSPRLPIAIRNELDSMIADHNVAK